MGRFVWLVGGLVACDPDPADPTKTTGTPTTFVPTGTGAAAGVWTGSCAGSFDVIGTVGGTGATPIQTTDTFTFDLDPATLRLSDDAGQVHGEFEYTRADLPALETDQYRVAGDRVGAALTLRIVGLASSSSTLPSTVTGVFPFSLDLQVAGDALSGDLVVAGDGGELGRVPCALSAP